MLIAKGKTLCKVREMSTKVHTAKACSEIVLWLCLKIDRSIMLGRKGTDPRSGRQFLEEAKLQRDILVLHMEFTEFGPAGRKEDCSKSPYLQYKGTDSHRTTDTSHR